MNERIYEIPFPHSGSRTLPGVYGIGRIEEERRNREYKKIKYMNKTSPAGWETSKKAVRDSRESSSFFGGKESVVFNKTIVALDFLDTFLSRKKYWFCFFDQKKAFVSWSTKKGKPTE